LPGARRSARSWATERRYCSRRASRATVARIILTRAKAGEKRRIACLCAESTVGLTLVILGIALTLAGVSDSVEIGRVGLTAGVAGVLAFGFVAKDYVISIRKEKDHASVIVW